MYLRPESLCTVAALLADSCARGVFIVGACAGSASELCEVSVTGSCLVTCEASVTSKVLG